MDPKTTYYIDCDVILYIEDVDLNAYSIKK